MKAGPTRVHVYYSELASEKLRSVDSYDGHERENVVLEVVSVISSHLDVDGHQNLDVPLHRV